MTFQPKVTEYNPDQPHSWQTNSEVTSYQKFMERIKKIEQRRNEAKVKTQTAFRDGSGWNSKLTNPKTPKMSYVTTQHTFVPPNSHPKKFSKEPQQKKIIRLLTSQQKARKKEDYIDLSECNGYGQCVNEIGRHIRDLDI